MKKILALLLSSFALGACATPPLPNGVTVAPDPVDFGPVFVGDTKTMNATLTNGSPNAINALGSAVSFGTVWGQTPPALPAAVAAAGTLAFPLSFTPPSEGPHTGTWHLTLDRRPYAIDLRGQGVLFLLESTQCVTGGPATAGSGLDFGDVTVGQHRGLDIEVRNIGAAPLVFPAAPAIAPAGTPFTVRQPGANTTIGAMPNPSMVKIRIRFQPPAVGRYTAVVSWADGTGGHRVKCFLQGNGVAPEGQ